MMNHYLPTRFFSGRGVLEERGHLLRQLGDSCLVVTGGSGAARSGALEELRHCLEANGIRYELWSGIRPNPPIGDCVAAGRRAHEMGAAFVLGLGGGSPLDAAKAAALSAANPELDGDGLYAAERLKPALPIALVGTTAGTGSEVTGVAVITDNTGRKHSFHREDLYARLAFGDPRYTETMPLSLTASTGVDALAHCLESYFSRSADALSRSLALGGVELLLPPLKTVAAGVLPEGAGRDALYEGSILGGMAINRSGTLFPHNLGYYLTERWGVPHGFACAAFLPELLTHAETAAPAELARLCRVSGMEPEALLELIRRLTPPMALDMTRQELETILPRWKEAKALRNTLGSVSMEQVRAYWETLCGLSEQ